MARIKGLLFDKDGTLFDFHRTWGAWTHGFILDLVNGGDPEPLADAMGYDLGASRFRRDSIVVAGSVDEWVDVILPHLGHWQRPDLIAHIKNQTAIVRQEPATDLDPLFCRSHRFGPAARHRHQRRRGAGNAATDRCRPDPPFRLHRRLRQRPWRETRAPQCCWHSPPISGHRPPMS